MSRSDDLKQLVANHQRRLQKLKEQQALGGVSTDPRILLEIEDVQEEIKNLRLELVELEEKEKESSDNTIPKIYHNLPQPDYEQFVGRQDELRQIYRLLRPHPKSRHFVITIDGIGGIGKSTLTLEVADSYRRNYDQLPEDERFEAIIWTSAKQTSLTADGIVSRPQSLNTLDDIYRAISITLERNDITRARSEEQHELVRYALAQQRTLLIVDNLETVDDDRVMAFISEVPDPTKVIVTTRHRLNIAYPIRLQGMTEAEALALIEDETQRHGLVLSEDEARQLNRRTGGVPLAIVWSVAQIGRGYNVETVLSRLGKPTHDIARFCFEGAVERIRHKEPYILLMALTLFSTGASREGLGYVADLPELDRDDGLIELERLSLINKVGNRFQMLPLTLLYSKAELDTQGKKLKESLRNRWVEYWLNFLREQGQKYENLELIRQEVDNILSAMDWCLTKGWYDRFIDFLEKMNFYLLATGDWSSWSKYLTQGSEIATNLNRDFDQANFYMWLSSMRYYQDELEEAEEFVEKAIHIYKLHQNKSELALAWRRLGSIQMKRGEFASARENLEKALTLAQEAENKRYISRIQRQLAKLDMEEGQYDSAKARLNQARELREQETELSSGLTYIYRLLGQVSFKQQDYLSARKYFAQSLEMGQRISSQHDIAEAKQGLAELDLAVGEVDRAKKLIFEAIESLTKLGMKGELRKAEKLLGQIQTQLNE
ncbi:MAG: tetratricopeptide repeat protein [Anaerolineae bacterium]|nr:tetratricopeptide repeat protein [Anaerolineae bacterium]